MIACCCTAQVCPGADPRPLSTRSREMSSDECSLHRFIVWVAVKRNGSARITPEQMRECPMLRCRRVFPNHEFMLQHLYSCEHLESSEYWCYDCGKAEHLGDVKCRRCLGHPSKRKRMMSLARNFFSSLGHKSKNGSLPDLDLDIKDDPPSYESALEPPKAELQSTEIHEIGSSEHYLATIPEAREEPESYPAYLFNMSSMTTTVAPQPQTVDLQNVRAVIDESLINWDLSPTPEPPNVAADVVARPSPYDRPVLQVHTQGLADYYRARSRGKSKAGMLAPSSSVRSTASTASTNSTSSTASHNISPMSAWSGSWSKAPGFDSALTSPADDLNLADVFPQGNSEYKRQVDFAAQMQMDVQDTAAGPVIQELPAELPTFDILHMPDALDTEPEPAPEPSSKEQHLEGNLAFHWPNNAQSSATMLANAFRNQYVDTPALIQTAQNVIEVHITHSMKGLRCDGKNHVVNQFCNMSAASVALAGLETMADLLSGNVVTSAVKLLCFVHVVYALSLVIDEQEAASRSTALFTQAVSYSSWLSRENKLAYIQVVDFLWKPDAMPVDDFVDLLRSSLSQPDFDPATSKGKAPATCQSMDRSDPLVFVAQYFLDEVEASVLRKATHIDIQASEVWREHINDINLDAHEGSPFAIAAEDAMTCLAQQHNGVPAFGSAMRDILDRVKSNHIATPRRLELELLQAGKMRLPLSVPFDNYILSVREQIDSLFQLFDMSFGHADPRLRYYRSGVQLVASVIGKTAPADVGMSNAEAAFEPLGFEGRMTPNMDDLLSQVPNCGLGLRVGLDVSLTDAPVPVRATSIPVVTVEPPAPMGASWMPTPEASSSSSLSSAAAGSPTSASPTPVSSSSKKVKADSCCDICGYRPKGDPRWFGGSMAKHRKLQHGTGPPKIYKCPYPGCTSQYKRRPDNLRQHQLDKGHFVDNDDDSSRRPSKKRKHMDR
ncbi:hypothetical protein JDV02_007875 [Purpureocillium takamizusanense]|uniref:C2H2-type domain-containing protein n=1 Tax=Purpureocillium takamizusanense TaxID=2060973 RepID=A0A9Q8VEK9_9HYPO|nr:uncharacterized protein JDV02_007875 [Purpureocillium takamizusanense]UNI21932.1 hypothetical protein JDV02_007875 [Purpureocillium takamizusanense]